MKSTAFPSLKFRSQKTNPRRLCLRQLKMKTTAAKAREAAKHGPSLCPFVL
jgi:hypothetical protein